MNYEQANSVKHLAPEVYDMLLKLGWKGWQPQVGEFICFPSPCQWIPLITDTKLNHIQVVDGKEIVWLEVEKNKLIPILEWEVIEGVLEKAGYVLRGSEFYQIGTGYAPVPDHRFSINKYGEMIVIAEASSRLIAVYMAVVELGKEMKQ